MRHLICAASLVTMATFSGQAFGGRWHTTQAPAAAMSPKPMVVTGCVRTWDPATMTAGGVSIRPADAAHFVLTDVTAEPAVPVAPPPSATSTPRTPRDTPTDAGAHGTYLLSAERAAGLASLVEQRVEVTGTLVADPETAAAAGAVPPPEPAPSATAKAPPRPPSVLRVSTVKAVAKTCT